MENTKIVTKFNIHSFERIILQMNKNLLTFANFSGNQSVIFFFFSQCLASIHQQ